MKTAANERTIQVKKARRFRVVFPPSTPVEAAYALRQKSCNQMAPAGRKTLSSTRRASRHPPCACDRQPAACTITPSYLDRMMINSNRPAVVSERLVHAAVISGQVVHHDDHRVMFTLLLILLKLKAQRATG